MALDPRRLLEEAAARRSPCEVLPRKGAWTRGTLIRVEKGGVVITTPQHRFDGGEDVRIWFALDGKPYTFEASVLRSGVPVPDRSGDGVLLGYIDRWTEGTPQAPRSERKVVEILPPHGPPISLLQEPARLVELTVEELAFTMPADYKIIFVEAGTVTLRLASGEHGPVEVHARVRELAPGEGYLLYGIRFEGVEDPELFRKVIAALAL